MSQLAAKLKGVRHRCATSPAPIRRGCGPAALVIAPEQDSQVLQSSGLLAPGRAYLGSRLQELGWKLQPCPHDLQELARAVDD